MATGNKKIKIPVPKGGLRPDKDPFELGWKGWHRLENCIYRDGDFGVRLGLSTFGNDINERPMGYIQYPHNDGTVRTVKATTVGWRKFNVSTQQWDSITGTALTSADTDHQVFRVFQKSGATWLLGTNRADSPKVWDGLTATYAAMGGSPPRAKCMMVLFDRILLGNLVSGSTVSGSAVDVSANKDFDSGWGSVQTTILADTPGDIVVASEMGPTQGHFIKTDAIFVVNAIGATAPFRFDLLMPLSQHGIETGPVSSAAMVVVTPGERAWLGLDGGVYIFDGVTVRGLGRHIQKHIVDTMNFRVPSRAWGLFDPQRQELVFVYPEFNKTSPNLAVVINRKTGEFAPYRWSNHSFSAGIKIDTQLGVRIGDLVGTIGQQDITIGEYGSTLDPRMVLGEIGGQSYKEDGLNDNGSAIPFFAETGLAGDGDRFLTVQEIEHRFAQAAAAQAVDVKVGKSDYGEDRVLGTASTLAVGSAGPYVSTHRTTLKHFSIRIEGNASQEVKWKGAQAVVVPRGDR